VRRAAPFDISSLSRAAHEFATLTHQAIAPHAPVVGERIFACETGLHVAAISRAPSLYEPFDPSLVGARRELCVGGKSGIEAIRQALLEEAAPVEVTPHLVSQVRRVSERLGRPLERRELMKLAKAA